MSVALVLLEPRQETSCAMSYSGLLLESLIPDTQKHLMNRQVRKKLPCRSKDDHHCTSGQAEDERTRQVQKLLLKFLRTYF